MRGTVVNTDAQTQQYPESKPQWPITRELMKVNPELQMGALQDAEAQNLAHASSHLGG